MGFKVDPFPGAKRQLGAPTKVSADEDDDYPHKELVQKLLVLEHAKKDKISS
jgi:hypothetical protein